MESEEDMLARRRAMMMRGFEALRQEERLREYVRTKQAAGVISAEHADAILGAVQDFYERQGLFRESGEQRAMHSNEIHGEFAVVRQGVHLMTEQLLELYPDLKDEVRTLASGSPPRR